VIRQQLKFDSIVSFSAAIGKCVLGVKEARKGPPRPGRGTVVAGWEDKGPERGGEAFVRPDAAGDKPAIRLRRDQSPVIRKWPPKFVLSREWQITIE
jgi:hypothetical protein